MVGFLSQCFRNVWNVWNVLLEAKGRAVMYLQCNNIVKLSAMFEGRRSFFFSFKKISSEEPTYRKINHNGCHGMTVTALYYLLTQVSVKVIKLINVAHNKLAMLCPELYIIILIMPGN